MAGREDGRWVEDAKWVEKGNTVRLPLTEVEKEREHGVSPSFRGGERQNPGRSNESRRQNQTGRQNMNRGGQKREKRGCQPPVYAKKPCDL